MSARAADAGPPVAFVLGTGRCGSTLVHELLAEHADVGFVSNVDDRLARFDPLGRGNRTLLRIAGPGSALGEKGGLRVAPSEGYRLLAAQVSPLVCDPARDLHATDATPWLARRLVDFVDRRSAAQGCRLFVHKFTGWPRVGLLRDIFPAARFVVVTRDGRAVASSLLQMPWWSGHRGPTATPIGGLDEPYRSVWREHGESFVALAGLMWAALVDRFEEVRGTVPARQWLAVRYEDLVREPQRSLARITSFLDLAPSPAIAEQIARRTFDADRLDAYRRDLHPDQVKLVEVVAHAQLERLGYLVPATTR